MYDLFQSEMHGKIWYDKNQDKIHEIFEIHKEETEELL